MISGRTGYFLMDHLFGIQDTIDDQGFGSTFDYRIDIDTGVIELQGASIGDQDGRSILHRH